MPAISANMTAAQAGQAFESALKGPSVESGITNLKANLDELSELARKLEARFEQVLITTHPEPAGNNTKAQANVLAVSPATGLLQELSGEAGRIADRLRDILNRCNL